MADTPATLAADLRAQLAVAADLSAQSQAAIARAERTLQALLQRGVERALETLPTCDAPPSAHRAAHRPGRPAKITTDPELQAFILARIDRLTYEQIADQVAEHFPPARRVRRSAIHSWWTKRRRR